MKICLFGLYSTSFVKGSATFKVQSNVHGYLNKQGVEAHLFSSADSKGLYKKLFKKLTFTETEEGLEITGGVIPFLMHLSSYNYDVVHFIVSRFYMFVIIPFIGFIKSKSVVTFHDCIIFPEIKCYRYSVIKLFLLKYLLYKFCDLVLVYNEIDKKNIERKFSITKTKLIKNGVTEKYFAVNHAKDKILSYAGGFENSYKGYEFLFEALQEVDCDYKLFLCGHGKSEGNLENYKGVLVEHELIQLFRESWLVVIPSRYDSFSLIGLEAMACGAPIIITRNCGLVKYLVDGEGCLIVDYGNTYELAKKIELILKDEQLRNRLSYQAQKNAHRFRWEIIIQEYIDVYSKLLQDKVERL